MKFILLSILSFACQLCYCQWIHSSSIFASSFEINSDKLYAGTEDGILCFNEESLSWTQTEIVGNILDFCFYENNIYCLQSGNIVVKLNQNHTVDKISPGLKLSEAEKLMKIHVYENSLIVTTTMKTLYCDLKNNNWSTIITSKNLPPIKRIKELVNFQGKLLCLADSGIYVSEDKKIYSKLIGNQKFLLHGELIRNIYSFNSQLYLIAGSHIYYSDDLDHWHQYDNFEVKMTFHRLCFLYCDGIVMGGLGGIYYSLDRNEVISVPKIPSDIKNGIPSLNDVVVFHNKIFSSGKINYKNGIWFINYNVQLKF